MFKKDKAIEEVIKDGQTIISQGIRIEGAKITGEGDICIDGYVQGTVDIKGELMIGETGNMDGDVRSDGAYIAGKFKGNLTIHGTLHLNETSSVEGDFESYKMVADEGARLNGKCRVLEPFGVEEDAEVPMEVQEVRTGAGLTEPSGTGDENEVDEKE